MNKNFKHLFVMLYIIGVIGISGCEDHQERYGIPPWLGGSSIETLEERGNYTIFLQLMEKANYTEPISKQLFTLFVPDDQAFIEHFKSIGKNSLDEFTKDEAVQLFTLHVLRNPRSRFQLIYEWAWSELQGPKGEYASLFHRKQTPSTSIPYRETIKYLPGRVGEEVLIYTGEKNVPLFTEEFFGDFGGASDGSDYLFMYPGSSWKKNYPSNLKGINWHNAMVLPNPEIPDELEVRTASGFIYFIDRVVSPMPNIEEYMIANQDRFGLYYDILQRFATYGNARTDEQNRIQFRKGYDLIFNLAEERGPSTNTAVPPQNMWSAFLPSNQALQQYLNNTVLKYYSSLDSVPRVTLYYILQTQLSATMVIPSKMERSYFNAFGDKTDIFKSDIISAYMTSNGPVYETTKVLEPNVFTCVPGILFFDRNYSTLLFVLNQADMLSSLANPDADVTLFATTNEKMEEYGIRYNATNAVVEFRGPIDGKWNPMRTNDLVMFAQDQVYKGRLSDFSGTGGYAELASGNFIHYSNNQLEASENQMTGNLATVTEITENERNGFLVKVDNPIESRFVVGQYLVSDPEVSEFANLLVSANLLDVRFRDPITREIIPNLKFYAGAKYWTGFIPTNNAMSLAREQGLIPVTYPKSTEGRDSINNFIMYHFIKNDVVFDDGQKSGEFNTNQTYKDNTGTTLNTKIRITNQPNNLTIHDKSGQEIVVDHAKAGILVRKGVCHKIDNVLNYFE
jgi:uncharacterized surface protein with fasciclin (FAS1) repeats